MPTFGKSKIGKSCFIDSRALIGYPHKNELHLLDNNPDDIHDLIKVAAHKAAAIVVMRSV